MLHSNYIVNDSEEGRKSQSKKRKGETGMCDCGEFNFYQITTNPSGVLMVSVDNLNSAMSIFTAECFCWRVFRKFMTRINFHTSCQKHISSEFDEAIKSLRETHDWVKSPICALKVIQEGGQKFVRIWSCP